MSENQTAETQAERKEALIARRRASALPDLVRVNDQPMAPIYIFGATTFVAFLVYSFMYGVVTMEYSLMDSLNLMMQILTTVGYGDLVPKTETQRVMTTVRARRAPPLFRSPRARALPLLLLLLL